MSKNYLTGINLGIIKENLQKKGFNLKKEDEYYFYSKEEQNIEQLITIIADEDKIDYIDMMSKHYHVNSDKDIMETNLECILNFVEVGIENLDIKKSLKKAMFLLKENEGIELIEESDFVIRTLNTNCERSITLSVD